MSAGRKKFKLQRLQQYANMLQFGMVAVLFAVGLDVDWWYLLALPVLFILAWRFMQYDYDRILPDELEAQYRHHPLRSDIQRLSDKIDAILRSK